MGPRRCVLVHHGLDHGGCHRLAQNGLLGEHIDLLRGPARLIDKRLVHVGSQRVLHALLIAFLLLYYRHLVGQGHSRPERGVVCVRDTDQLLVGIGHQGHRVVVLSLTMLSKALFFLIGRLEAAVGDDGSGHLVDVVVFGGLARDLDFLQIRTRLLIHLIVLFVALG